MPQGPPPQSTVGVALPRSGVPPLGLRQLHPISPLTHMSPPLPLPCCCLPAYLAPLPAVQDYQQTWGKFMRMMSQNAQRFRSSAAWRRGMGFE